MRYFFLLIFLFFIITGCGVHNEQNVLLLPREYYRTILRNQDIGVAIKENNDDINGIIPTLLNNDKLSDAFYVTYNGEEFIGVKIKPYHRKNRQEILQEVSEASSVKITNIIEEPRRYREMEKLIHDKQTGNINEQWISEWKKLTKDF